MKLTTFILLVICLVNIPQDILGQEKFNKKTLNSSTKARQWNNVKYLFISTSSPTKEFKQRSFLIDKSSGRTRFEGKTNNNQQLVVLFNYKSKALLKSYIDGKLNNNKRTAIPFQEILDQLFEDSKFVFLPMLISCTSQENLAVSRSKLINAEKLIELNFKNVHNINNQTINGSVYVNHKNEIKQYQFDEQKYLIGDIKDVGDGILLPTRFSVEQEGASNQIKFNTVAAFTDIENEKFTTF